MLEGIEWKSVIKNYKNSIIFIDEGNRFVSSTDLKQVYHEFYHIYNFDTQKDSYLKYSKKSLNKNYLSKSIKEKILNSDAFTTIRKLLRK